MGRRNTATMFPWLLHDMLESAHKRGLEHIVSWHPSGKSFKVHDRDRFIVDVLPHYVAQTKYKSFVRQLNLWGFSCIHGGRDSPERGSYQHQYFIRGHPDLCQHMKRVKVKGKAAKMKSMLKQQDAALAPALLPAPIIPGSSAPISDAAPASVVPAAGTASIAAQPSAVPVPSANQQQGAAPIARSYSIVSSASTDSSVEGNEDSPVPSGDKHRKPQQNPPGAVSESADEDLVDLWILEEFNRKYGTDSIAHHTELDNLTHPLSPSTIDSKERSAKVEATVQQPFFDLPPPPSGGCAATVSGGSTDNSSSTGNEYKVLDISMSADISRDMFNQPLPGWHRQTSITDSRHSEQSEDSALILKPKSEDMNASSDVAFSGSSFHHDSGNGADTWNTMGKLLSGSGDDHEFDAISLTPPREMNWEFFG